MNWFVTAVGAGIAAKDAQVVEAHGRPLTPTLFGGVTGIGIEEVSGERGTRDDRGDHIFSIGLSGGGVPPHMQ